MPRELPTWLLPALIVAGGVIFVWQDLRPQPQTLLACAFIQRSAATPVRVPGAKVLVSRLWLEGRLERTAQDGMFNFEGSTSASGGKAKGGARTSGNVWLDGRGAVEGMALWASHPEFRSQELRIDTLNSDGHLDTDHSTAFLFMDPPEKLLHPADYVCSVHKH